MTAVILAMIAALIAVAAVVVVMSRGGEDDDGATGDGADAGAPSVPLVVNVEGAESYMNVNSINKWAADVSNRDEEALVRKCWTYPRSYIQQRYLAEPDRVAKLMGMTPAMTQAGPSWTTGLGGDDALLSWAEAKSEYGCPEIRFAEDDGVHDDLIRYRAERYIRREQGRPVNSNDTEPNYPLACAFVTGTITNIENADPDDMEMLSSSSTEWVVRAGAVTIKMHQEPGITCIESAQ